MTKTKRKRMTADRRQQVETTKQRHGPDYYHVIGKKGAKYDSDKGRLAALKRWHPDWFDTDGNLKEERANESTSV